MSEIQDIEKQQAKPFKSFKIISSTLFGFILRAAQWFVTILVLGLSAGSIDKYATSGSMSYTVFASVFTLLYLIVFTILSFVSPLNIIIGVNVILEILITIFWFTSFISIAAIYGPSDCNYHYSGWYYIYYINKNACQASKAAIAFAAVNFALFLVSALALSLTSISNISTDQLFQQNSISGASLNRPLIAVTSIGTSPVAFQTDNTNVESADTLNNNAVEQEVEPKEEGAADEVSAQSPVTTVTPAQNN